MHLTSADGARMKHKSFAEPLTRFDRQGSHLAWIIESMIEMRTGISNPLFKLETLDLTGNHCLQHKNKQEWGVVHLYADPVFAKV